MPSGHGIDPITRYRIEQMFSARRPDGGYVTLDAIARRYEVSRRTVQRILREMADLGAQVTRIRR